MPLIMAVCVVIGIMIGSFFANRFSGNRLNVINSGSNRITNLLRIIDDMYVDKVDIDSLVEDAMPKILAELDPHSVYISAKDVQSTTDDLKGSFSGIGVEFIIRQDTIHVQNVIKNGPAERAGMLAGDKIISVNGKSFVGKIVTNEEAMRRLKGPKDTKVKVGVVRYGHEKPVYMTITRGEIPTKSITSVYMLDDKTGYIKIKNFGETTYTELLIALAQLSQEGFTNLVIDLRDNVGGYLDSAVQMANEFLPKNKLIVYTEGRKSPRREYRTNGQGSYQDIPLVVLINEGSASASEIFAGAMQDNDRGTIIGRRSFGKGLVQREFRLFDNSAIRLTIARYYTPTGRCIQKDYKLGQAAYERELLNRFNNGELDTQDSIKVDKSKSFKTPHGRIVYGGGGIIPDIFVPRDTTGFTSYYYAVVNEGLIQNFVLKYVAAHKSKFKNADDYKDVIRLLDDNTTLLNSFVEFASAHNVPARWYYINQSRDLILNDLKAFIARDLLGQKAFYPIYNRHDKTIEAALKALNKHKAAFPITAD